MKLKCIGGELDGKVIETEEIYRNGDSIRLQKLPTKFEVKDFSADIADLLAPVPTPFTYYIVGYISGVAIDGDIETFWYCYPQGTHPWEALLHQMSK